MAARLSYDTEADTVGIGASLESDIHGVAALIGSLARPREPRRCP